MFVDICGNMISVNLFNSITLIDLALSNAFVNTSLIRSVRL